jgi:DUF971 family protein
MRPANIQAIGGELAIKWEDGSETYLALEKLRRQCPCAGCKGETDVMGHVWKGQGHPLPARAFQLVRIEDVGTYGIQPVWGDGHATGIYTFDFLRQMAA